MLRSLVSTCGYQLGGRVVGSPLFALTASSQFQCINSIFTSSIWSARCSAPTKKRRKTYPYHWLPRSEIKTSYKSYLTPENAKFVEDVVKEKFSLQPGQSPLKLEQLERSKYEPGSIRCGVIAKKIGHYPMWTKNGQRLLTTALQIVDNHVVSYSKNEDVVQMRRPFYNFHKFKDLDVIVVGADSADPRQFPVSYLSLFNKANIPPKKKLTRFFVTPNAKLAPGTPLTVNHFRVGDYVDCWGKTRDWGFQGVIKRWKFKGQLLHRGVTKAHRRPGTIARGRKLMGPPKGKKMPGHMGSERRVLKGLKIWRINTKHNVIWVQGPAVPGANNSWVYIYDSTIEGKKHSAESHPPFPTYYEDSKQTTPDNYYATELHAFDEPSLLFEETEEEKKAALAALKMAKKAKIAKIR